VSIWHDIITYVETDGYNKANRCLHITTISIKQNLKQENIKQIFLKSHKGGLNGENFISTEEFEQYCTFILFRLVYQDY
jgi:hypothetical protein